jgi:hypothetical protein
MMAARKEMPMTSFAVSPFLRTILLADAVATGLTGLAMALAARPLGNILQLPVILLIVAGLVLLPYAALVVYLASRDRLQPSAIWTLIGCNVLWGFDCAVVALSGWVSPSALGYAFIFAQVLVVVAFAELQYVGLRRALS